MGECCELKGPLIHTVLVIYVHTVHIDTVQCNNIHMLIAAACTTFYVHYTCYATYVCSYMHNVYAVCTCVIRIWLNTVRLCLFETAG